MVWKCFPFRINRSKPPNSFSIIATHPICARSGCNWRSGITGRSPEANEVAIRFSPISRDGMEIDASKCCQTTWLVEPLQRMCLCILTYLGHDLTLTWPDLRSNFQIDLLRSKSTCSEPARRGEHDGIIFIFVSPISKKVLMKNRIREKTIFFIWWPLEPKLLKLGQIWS